MKIERYVDYYCKCCEYAEDSGITITVESTGYSNSPVTSADECLKILRQIPELRLTFDQGNVATADAPFEVQVIRVESIAATFKESPLLQPYGGPLAVYPGPDNNLKSSQTLYRVDLEILDENKPISGRVLQVNLESKQQLYKKVLSFIISFFRRNF